MRAFLKKHHIFMKFLALLGAVILWVVSIKTDNPRKTLDFQNLEVQLLGRETLLNRNHLALTEIETETISLKVAGYFDALSGVNSDSISVRADLSSYTEPGSYRLSYEVSLPDGVMVVERNPVRIPIVLEEIVEKEVDVRVEYVGTFPSGVSIDKVKVEPSTVRISGASGVMEQAKHALVQIDASLLTDDYNSDLSYVITDENGSVLQSPYTTFIDSTVNVDIPVYMAKSVPVEANILTSAGVPKNSVAMVFEPATIKIFGRAEDVQKIRSINVGEINVRDFVLTYDADYPVVLPDGVDFYEDVVETVNVYVYFRDIETKKVTSSNIILENVPDDLNVTLETQSLDLTVRSSREKLNNLNLDSIKITADLDGLALKPGRITVPATVKVTIGGYDVCGTYSVVINVQEPVTEEGSDT